MGCVLMKQRRVFLDPTLLSSQTRFTVEEVKSLNELFQQLGGTILDDGFMTREEFKLGLFGDGKKMSLLADRVRHLLYSPTVCFFSCTWITSHDGAFTGQMFDLLDSNHDGVIDFGEFVRSLNVFHPDTPQVEKAICRDQISMFYNTLLQMPQKHDQPQAHGNVLLCDFTVAFKLYDIWETGFIERGEVKEMITELLNESDLVLSDDIVEAIIDKTFEEADSDKDGKIDIEEWKDLAVQKPSILLRNMTIPYLKGLQFVALW